jgi:sortase A
MKPLLRLLSYLLIAGGVLVLAWVIVVWQWQDPFTAIYTHIEQSHLSSEYKRDAARVDATVRPVERAASAARLRADLAREALAYGRTLQTGHALGRITIGRIGLKMVVVQGTDDASLQKGPGHYATSGLPGGGSLIYIAGHRTTFLAPFADINDIRVGDYVTLEVPYGTFTYRVTRHYIVAATDLAMLVNHGSEVLRLQACHPRFFATNRYIVDARPVSVTLPGGKTYPLAASIRLPTHG